MDINRHEHLIEVTKRINYQFKFNSHVGLPSSFHYENSVNVARQFLFDTYVDTYQTFVLKIISHALLR